MPGTDGYIRRERQEVSMSKRLYNALKDCKKEVGLDPEEFAALKVAHDALRAKMLPKVYEFGFLNPDMEVFK